MLKQILVHIPGMTVHISLVGSVLKVLVGRTEEFVVTLAMSGII